MNEECVAAFFTTRLHKPVLPPPVTFPVPRHLATPAPEQVRSSFCRSFLPRHHTKVLHLISRWLCPLNSDKAMASTSAATGGPAASTSELSRLEVVESLKTKAGPVRRNLFGPMDHQQLQQDFQRLLCVSVEEANKRWNFDFWLDRPGEGAGVQWVELRCQDVPAFYRSRSVRPGVRSKRRTSMSSVSSSGGASPMSSSSSGSGDEYLEVITKRCYSIQRPQKRKQSAITGELNKYFLFHWTVPVLSKPVYLQLDTKHHVPEHR